jgi:transketolase
MSEPATVDDQREEEKKSPGQDEQPRRVDERRLTQRKEPLRVVGRDEKESDRNHDGEQRGRKTGGTIYVVLSDGEVQEGSTWEAVLMASSLRLDNLVAAVDNNDLQSLGRTSVTHPSLYPLVEKFSAFGWEVAEVDGHDGQAIFAAVAGRRGDRPFMLVAKTTKGRGVSYMENVPIWHYRSPNPDEYRRAIDELETLR